MRKLLALVAVGFAFASASAQIDNGYQRRPRTKETVEPSAEIRAVAYSIDIELTPVGEEMLFTPATEINFSVCQTCDCACWPFCEAQIVDPYCAQVGSWADGSVDVGCSCHCGYVCTKDSHGVQHKPQRLMAPQ